MLLYFFLMKITFVLEWLDLQMDCRDGTGSSRSPAVPYLAMSVCQNWDMHIANAPSHQVPPNAFSYPGIQPGTAELEMRWGCGCWGSKQAKARLGEGLKMAAFYSFRSLTLVLPWLGNVTGGSLLWCGRLVLSDPIYKYLLRCWGGGQGEMEALSSWWGGEAGNREGLGTFQLHLVSPSPVGFLSKRVFKSFCSNVSHSDKC